MPLILFVQHYVIAKIYFIRSNFIFAYQIFVAITVDIATISLCIACHYWVNGSGTVSYLSEIFTFHNVNVHPGLDMFQVKSIIAQMGIEDALASKTSEQPVSFLHFRKNP